MSTIINATTTNGVVIQPDNSGSLQLATNSGTTAVTVDTSQRVGIGTTSPGALLHTYTSTQESVRFARNSTASSAYVTFYANNSSSAQVQYAGILGDVASSTAGSHGGNLLFYTTGSGTSAERMRVTDEGRLLIGKTAVNFGVAGGIYNPSGSAELTVNGGTCLAVNRLTNDGTLISFSQAGTEEGTISVSGTTVSYNGGHLSRWSQWQNETGKPNIYRGSVLESVDAMCEWEKKGQPLPNEQATKTIVSTTISSKAVAGVFDRYDEDDETNPYDFYVAQSGDFVIRIAQGVTVQNGDLLESAGDGTAKPQADDICRSSTIAKVTSNYVSATYEDGSYCVPCILMIG